MADVVGPLPGTVTFVASDGYSKTFKSSDLGRIWRRWSASRMAIIRSSFRDSSRSGG